jgi:hypothetical protein
MACGRNAPTGTTPWDPFLSATSRPLLIDLHPHSDGQIFSSQEMRDWFDTVVPGLSLTRPTHVLGGDLPKRDWFDQPRSPLRYAGDSEIHTVSPGRPIGAYTRTMWLNWLVMAFIYIFTVR